MSDNIEPDVIERELDAQLRIPNEVWTDIMKLLPRRFLVKRIAPVCYRFKEICDKNVKSVHVIRKATWFSYKLKKNDAIAKKQLKHLSDNDCKLAGQFRLTKIRVIEENKAIVSHCPDLFDGCKNSLVFKEKNKSSTLFAESLSQLEKTKPVVIKVGQSVDQVIDFWHHPTFQNCSRIKLAFRPSLSDATMMTVFGNIFDWLHLKPTGMDSDGTADQKVRCMIVYISGEKHIDWLINRCSENLQNSDGPADRLPYVFSFFCCFDWEWNGFRRVENKSTGEVLTLDRVMNEGDGKPTYRLRRCLAEEIANGQKFYAGMFKRIKGFDAFEIADKTPKVLIE